MARKNRYEFRPDKQNNDILGKLLLTRQQFSCEDILTDTAVQRFVKGKSRGFF